MNSPEAARRWTEFRAARKEIPDGERLLEHFNGGVITRICDCGCNSYASGLTSLLPAKPGSHGSCVLSIAFNLRNREGSLEFDVFADANGYLGGIDVSCNAISEPVPDNPQLFEPSYHIDGALLQKPDNA
jgi:hypothetical protein